MKDLFPCAGIREDFQRWLGCGVGPLTITQRGQAAATLNSLPKMDVIISAAVNRRVEDIVATADRALVKMMLGPAGYCAEDITRITCGRNTLYESEPTQTEEMGPVMQMEGI